MSDPSSFISNIPSWVVTVLSGLVGVALGYGYLKGQVAAMKENQTKTEDKVTDLEKRKEAVMIRTDCNAARADCQSVMRISLQDVKDCINDGQTKQNEQYAEIKEMLGYVRRALEERNEKRS